LAGGLTQKLLDDGVNTGIFPGASLAVGTSTSVTYYYSGVTTSLPGGSVVQQSTVYDIASLTKVFTTTSTLLLMERGLLRLDDPVALFLPSFSRPDKQEITLRHLLTHTSGLAAHEPLYMTCRGPDELQSAIAATPLQHEPGKTVVYSCLGYIILGQALEKIYGASLATLLRQEICIPLGMARTGYAGPSLSLDLSNVAPTEMCAFRARMAWGEVHDENAYAQGGISGNAGVFSTVLDMATFAQALLCYGSCSESNISILSRATVKLATLNHTPGLNERRGLGWQHKTPRTPWCGDLAAESSYGHTGFTGTSLWISPEQDLFVVLLSNRVHPTRDNNKHIRFRALIHNAIIASHTRSTRIRAAPYRNFAGKLQPSRTLLRR